MKSTVKNGFTLVELIVVITIIAILGTISFVAYNSYIRDSDFTTDNTKRNQITNLINTTFIRDIAVDGKTNTDHAVRFSQADSTFISWTEDRSDNGDLTYAEAAAVLSENFSPNYNLPSGNFGLRICDADVTQANLDSVINTETSGPYYELILYTNVTGDGTNCAWTITADSTELAAYTFRYKNAKLVWTSDSYDAQVKLDGGSRISTVAANTAWENVLGVHKTLNSSTTITNKGY